MGKTSLVIFKRDCMGCHACSKACPTGCIFWGDTQRLHRRIDLEILGADL